MRCPVLLVATAPSAVSPVAATFMACCRRCCASRSALRAAAPAKVSPQWPHATSASADGRAQNTQVCIRLALQRAQRLQDAPGIYTLQAAIAACHAQARRAADTDWRHIAALYALLETLIASPVVALNRAVAIGRANGPAAALPLVEALNRDARMQQYPWAAAAYGDLLQQLGRRDEARRAFERAAALAGNEHDRLLMRERADAV